jgi:hypothetical protein
MDCREQRHEAEPFFLQCEHSWRPSWPAAIIAGVDGYVLTPTPPWSPLRASVQWTLSDYCLTNGEASVAWSRTTFHFIRNLTSSVFFGSLELLQLGLWLQAYWGIESPVRHLWKFSAIGFAERTLIHGIVSYVHLFFLGQIKSILRMYYGLVKICNENPT